MTFPWKHGLISMTKCFPNRIGRCIMDIRWTHQQLHFVILIWHLSAYIELMVLTMVSIRRTRLHLIYMISINFKYVKSRLTLPKCDDRLRNIDSYFVPNVSNMASFYVLLKMRFNLFSIQPKNTTLDPHYVFERCHGSTCMWYPKIPDTFNTPHMFHKKVRNALSSRCVFNT